MKEIKLYEKVYEAVLGMYADEEDYLIEGIRVQDEFTGKKCDEHYEQIYKAKEKLRLILSEEAFGNVEVVEFRMNEIMREVALKMFEYGMEYAKALNQ